MLAVISLGYLVERPLGIARTVCVIGVSGIVSMLAIGGLIGGYLIGWIFYETPKRFPQRWLPYVGAIAVGVVSFVGALWAATTTARGTAPASMPASSRRAYGASIPPSVA